MPRPLAAGNWKMNAGEAGLPAALAAVTAVDHLICPPATLLKELAGQGTAIGAQDCHHAASGAHTGDLSAPLVAATGATHVILGHSERRTDHGESDREVAAKVQAAWDNDLVAVLCIGETLKEREAGETLAVVESQLSGSLPGDPAGATTVVAYEPVWAIGTGKVATPDQAQEVHASLRGLVREIGGPLAEDMRILYGGSVKPDNVDGLMAMADIDGALVGGAALDADSFARIVQFNGA